MGARLSGVSVVVAGAGLAGLTAARELEADDAKVIVVEARDRVGGRVHTIRDGFSHRQHAEGGADLIEQEQTQVRALASAMNLSPVQTLRGGFGYYGLDDRGQRRIRRGPAAFREAEKLLKDEIDDYCLAGRRWDSAVAEVLGAQSVADWLTRIRAGVRLSSGMRGMRGFFLADPEDLSLLAPVDQFSAGGAPGGGKFFRIRGGNDRLPRAMAKRLRGEVRLGAVLRRVKQSGSGVTVTVEDRGQLQEITCDYVVAAMPTTTLRDVEFRPALCAEQQRAIQTLRYGRATRLLLQFERPFWRKAGRPRGFGSDLPVGTVWDGAEEQRGPGILSLLAGGRASDELQQILVTERERGVLERLAWLGKPSRLVASRRITWEEDPWARGGYAFFDPGFDPRLRAWLSRPAGRVLFAGEHTSLRWQGYMNGAVESGSRAAAEIRALARRDCAV
jgi:monoamine oxidase